MGEHCQEDNSLLFWGVRKTNYTNSSSVLLLTLLQFNLRVKIDCFFFLGNFQIVGQCAIWREIMWGEVSSVIYSSTLWV